MESRMKKYLLILFILFLSTSFAQWKNVSGDLPFLHAGYSVHALNKDIALVTFHNKLFRTDNGGKNWLPIASDFKVVDVIMLNSSIVIAATTGKIIKSIDGGQNWEVKFSGDNLTEFFNYLEMFNDNDGVAVGDALNSNSPMIVVKTSDGGETWSKNNSLPNGYISADTWKRICFVNSSTGYFIVNSSNDLAITTNSGDSWQLTSCPTSGKNVVKFADQLNGIVFGYDYLDPAKPKYIFITTDGGKSWETLPGVKSKWCEDIEFFKNDKNKILMCTDNRLYFSDNFAKNWVDLTPQLNTDSTKVLRDLHITDDGSCWLIGDGSRVFRHDNVQLITNVNKEIADLPAEFNLYQNFPNPFNPSTQINYEISKSGHYQLAVYNVLSERIAMLINRKLEPGSYSVHFNINNIPNGVYFYSLTGNGINQSKKMVLLN